MGGLGSSESSFVFNVPVWLRDHVPRNGLKVLTNFKYPTECANIRRLHNIFLVWHQALVWEGQDYLWKSASKVSKKISIWYPFSCSRDWLTLFLRWADFSRATSCDLFFVKNALLKYLFLLEEADQFFSRLRAIVQELLERSKNCIPKSSTVFQKNAIKMKMLFSKQLNELGFLMHPKLMHQILNFSDAPDKKCLCAPRA